MKNIILLGLIAFCISNTLKSQNLFNRSWQLQNPSIDDLSEVITFQSNGVINDVTQNLRSGYKEVKNGSFRYDENILYIFWSNGNVNKLNLKWISNSQFTFLFGQKEYYFCLCNSNEDKYFSNYLNKRILKTPYNLPPSIPFSSGPGSNTNTQPKKEICYTCHGLGTCQVCGGTGRYSSYGNSVSCSACNGRGKCWHCQGSGIQ